MNDGFVQFLKVTEGLPTSSAVATQTIAVLDEQTSLAKPASTDGKAEQVLTELNQYVNNAVASSKQTGCTVSKDTWVMKACSPATAADVNANPAVGFGSE